MNVTIDCAQIRTKEDLHKLFASILSFPDWYGKNLDALHDCLCSLSGTLRLENWAEAEAKLGKYGIAARNTIAAAGLENRDLDILF